MIGKLFGKGKNADDFGITPGELPQDRSAAIEARQRVLQKFELTKQCELPAPRQSSLHRIILYHLDGGDIPVDGDDGLGAITLGMLQQFVKRESKFKDIIGQVAPATTPCPLSGFSIDLKSVDSTMAATICDLLAATEYETELQRFDLVGNSFQHAGANYRVVLILS